MTLFRPLKPHLWYLLLLWLLPLAVYLKTLSPSILYIDAGTIITAAQTLGIPNPPGFPSYIMIAHLFTKLPLGTTLFKVQLLSIISALGVVTLVYFLVQRLILTDFWFVHKSNPDNRSFLRLNPRGLIGEAWNTQAKICALAASLVLAFSYQFWSQTLNTESYIFTNFLMMSMLSLVLTVPAAAKNLTKRVLVGAVILGIASGANPTIVQSLPALALAGLLFWKRIGVKGILPAALVAILITALVYSFLPIRAAQYPFLNWGTPNSAELFWGHLKGEGLDIYDPRTNSINGFTGSGEVFMMSLGRYVYLAFMQFTPLLLPLIGLGAFYLFRKNKKLWLVLLTIPVVNLLFGGLYMSGNQESWFTSSYIIFAIFIGIGLSFALKCLLSLIGQRPILPLVFILLPLIWWFPKLDRSSQITTTEYEYNIYSNLPKNTVLIGSGDFFNSMSNYEHEVLKNRPDVFPIVANMWYILPWYRDNLRHQRVDLIPQELEKMIKKDRFEEYNEVMNWYIKWLLDKGIPVYVTPTVFQETVLAGTDAGKYVPDPKLVRAVPMGLAYRMVEAHDLLQPDKKMFDYHFQDPSFYKKKPFYLERNYKAAWHLLVQDYATSFAEAADYYQKAGNKEEAMTFISRAYEFAPFSGVIVNRVGIFAAMMGDSKQAMKYFKEASNLEPKSLEIRMNLANAMIAEGKDEEAKKELQIILAGTDKLQLRQDAEGLLAQINAKQLAGNIPADWKSYSAKGGPASGWEFSYPPDWQIRTEKNGVVVLSAPEDGFAISFFGGTYPVGSDPMLWAKTSPIKFSGKKENEGPAQIPPFVARAAFWTESDGKKALEFTLTLDKRILHLKIKPADSKQMQKLDQILSTIKFQ